MWRERDARSSHIERAHKLRYALGALGKKRVSKIKRAAARKKKRTRRKHERVNVRLYVGGGQRKECTERERLSNKKQKGNRAAVVPYSASALASLASAACAAAQAETFVAAFAHFNFENDAGLACDADRW